MTATSPNARSTASRIPRIQRRVAVAHRLVDDRERLRHSEVIVERRGEAVGNGCLDPHVAVAPRARARRGCRKVRMRSSADSASSNVDAVMSRLDR